MPTCRRTARAEQDLIDLWLFIAADNPTPADQLLDHLEAAFQALARTPGLCAARPDLARDLRTFVVRGVYLILYRQIAGGVEIVRVVHGMRHLPALV